MAIGQVGHVYDPDKPETLPTFARKFDPERRKAWAAAATEQDAKAADCKECGRGLRASEILPHSLKHAPSRLRPIVGTFFQQLQTDEDRDAALTLIAEIREALRG